MLAELVASTMLLFSPPDSTLEQRLVADGYDDGVVNELFEDYTPNTTVQRLFQRNPERRGARGSLTLEEYMDALNIEYLKREIPGFLEDHAEALRRAERTHFVDKRYVASIIGVESQLGLNTGNFNVPNTLKTIHEEVPRKKSFAYEQSTCLVELVDAGELESASSLQGSYAAGIGFGQFLPCSLRDYFDGDVDDMDDTIMSVARYLANFHKHHDDTGEPLRWDPAKNGVPATYKEETGERGGNYYALFGYNESWLYVLAVDALARSATRTEPFPENYERKISPRRIPTYKPVKILVPRLQTNGASPQ